MAKNANQDQLILLDFYKEDCGQCQTMLPVLETLKQRLGNALEIVPVDVAENFGVAVAYKVRSVPALILLKNRAICWRQEGLLSGRDLEKIIRQFMS